MIAVLLRILRTSLGAPLARRTFGSLFCRVAGTGAGFLAAVALARLLGQAAYGAYVTWMSILALAATLGGLGLPQLVLKEVAAARGGGAGWAEIRDLLVLTLRLTLAVAAAGILAGALAGGGPPLLAGAILAVLLANSLVGALQQGFEHVLRSQIAGLLQPACLIGGAILLPHLTRRPLGVEAALLLQLGAALLGLLAGFLLLAAGLERGERRALTSGRGAGRFGPRLTAGLLLMANQFLVNAQTQLDVLMLGWLEGPEAVALYHAASRGAYVLTFLFGALTGALAPTVARLHAAGAGSELAATVARAAGSTLLASAALALVLAVAGPFYLGLFGAGFRAGYPAFLVLLAGWLGGIACGPAQTVLMMTGEARLAALVLAAGTAGNLVLGLVLIPLAGALGAAAASAFAVVLSGLAWAAACRRRLGLRVDGLAGFRRRENAPAVAAARGLP
ncbi:lipopolysaccharide biosynthesis protein [Benzoatithermus flavus]|uniref:Oligosaccharide flippase family protein n=1 Tax=Benzoatithermus flavus TaxID=3108223 RepID=A0ABU8XXW6_9PROT